MRKFVRGGNASTAVIGALCCGSVGHRVWVMYWGLVALGCNSSVSVGTDAGDTDTALRDSRIFVDTATDRGLPDQYISDDTSVDRGPLPGPCDCDDGDPATPDACCEDGDPITDNVCLAGLCVANDNCDRCTDGDPATEDLCLGGNCFFIDAICRPGSSLSCADDNPVTEDFCETTGRSLRCIHRPYPGFCVTAADCTSSDVCLTNARCDEGRCRHDTVPDCDARTQQIPTCPDWARAGGPCVAPAAPETIIHCLSNADATCPVRLTCDSDVFAPGGPTFYAVVNAACDARCGESPSHRSSCVGPVLGCDYSPNTDQTIPIDPNNAPPNVYYDGYDPSDQPVCVCTRQGIEHCTFDCPPVPPAPGDTSALPGPLGCSYRDQQCFIEPTRNTEGRYPWVCEGYRICPTIAPIGPNVACSQIVNGECGYSRYAPDQPVTTYAGTCACEESGFWSCTPSASADCPMAPPTDGSPCQRSPGNRTCNYLNESAVESSRYCSCGGLSTWSCR